MPPLSCAFQIPIHALDLVCDGHFYSSQQAGGWFGFVSIGHLKSDFVEDVRLIVGRLRKSPDGKHGVHGFQLLK